jgi:hypothetical protein
MAAVRSSHSVVSNGLATSVGQKVGWISRAARPGEAEVVPAEEAGAPESVADASKTAMGFVLLTG